MPNDLPGMRILIVEDEYYLAADLAEELRERGATVIGPVGSVEQAMAAIDAGGIDRVILDMNLRGEMTSPIAARLDAAGIPYLIATGYSAESVPEALREKPRIEKPFRPEKLAELLGLTPGEAA